MRLTVNISPRKVALTGIVIAAAFVAIDLITQYARYYPFDYPFRYRVDRLFHLGREANIPAWFSTILLLASAMLLGVIACAKAVQRQPFRHRWLALSLIFIYLSVDEAAMLHEEIGGVLADLFPNSIFVHGWFIFGGCLVVLFAAIYWRFFLSLPLATRRLILMAAITFVGGAIGIEVLALPYENGRVADYGFALLVALEEFMEMAGIVLFIYALLDYVYATVHSVQLIIFNPDAVKHDIAQQRAGLRY